MPRAGCLAIKIREVISGIPHLKIAHSSLPDMYVYAHGRHVGEEELYGKRLSF